METARRVDTIVGMMQREEWRSESSAELAHAWRVSVDTVQGLAAEASRRCAFILGLTEDPERLKSNVAGVLMRSLHLAHEERARGDVARLGDIVTKITGARVAEKHSLDVSMRQYEELEPSALLARIRDQRARLEAAEAKILEEHPELVVLDSARRLAATGGDPCIIEIAPAEDSTTNLTEGPES